MKALLLCASHNDLGLILAIKKLGYEIVVTGNKEGLIGEKYADKYIKADYSNKELILDIAIKEKIDVICPCCNDFGVYTAAFVAQKMQIGNFDSYETTLQINNKDRFKKLAEPLGIITPKAQGFNDAIQAKEYAKTIDFPLIIKPTDASAGNGITKVEKKEDMETAIDFAFSKSKAGRIVIEEYISGTQCGFCTFLIDQKVVAVCSNNEYSMINPYRVEIDTYPAENYKIVSKLLIEEIEKIANYLKLKDGIFHLQYIEKNGVPYIIEVMRRVLGNMYSVPANMVNNFNWDYYEVKARFGLDLCDFPKTIKQEGFYAYKTILAKANGTIKQIEIPSRYDKFIVEKCILKKNGELIENYKTEPIGFVFMIFKNMKEMKKLLVEEYDNDFVTME